MTKPKREPCRQRQRHRSMRAVGVHVSDEPPEIAFLRVAKNCGRRIELEGVSTIEVAFAGRTGKPRLEVGVTFVHELEFVRLCSLPKKKTRGCLQMPQLAKRPSTRCA